MEFTTHLLNPEHLPIVQQAGLSEVLLEHRLLSRLGTLDTPEFQTLLDQTLAAGLTPVVVWDVLAEPTTLAAGIRTLDELKLPANLNLRAQDAGVAEWVRLNRPDWKLHWLVEGNTHNLTGLKRWEAALAPQLVRLVLSSELPGALQQQYAEQLQTPCETLGAGRLLLFHSPRPLLSALNTTVPYQERQISTDAQGRHPHPIVENQHGTFMFHNRDLVILDRLASVSALHTLRLDLRFHPDFSVLPELVALAKQALKGPLDAAASQQLSDRWPTRTTHGFFRTNRTERPIERLRNPHRQIRDERLVAWVVEAVKQEHLALFTRQPLQEGMRLLALTPSGKEVSFTLESLRNASGAPQATAAPDTLCLIPHLKYLTPRTLIYQIEADFPPEHGA